VFAIFPRGPISILRRPRHDFRQRLATSEVIRALRAGDIEVTAIHSHMLDEQPRMFFIHFWADDDAVKLARRPCCARQNCRRAALAVRTSFESRLRTTLF
jgi:hypothetical protein